MFRAKFFQNSPKIMGGLSKRQDGPMELAVDLKLREPNRMRYFKKQNISPLNVASAIQNHSVKVARITSAKRYKGDGLVTNKQNITLTVTVADCFPVYFYNPKSNYIGIIHSGWRGTANNISKSAIQKLKGNIKDLKVLIGPGIQAHHFEIKGDILSKFRKYPSAIIKRHKKLFVDLPKIIKMQLIRCGVDKKNIETCRICTFCEKKKYFSYRRDKPAKVQAMLSWLVLK